MQGAARSRFGVETLGVTRDANIKRRIDKNLDELTRFDQFADHLPFGLEWGDESTQDDETGIDHEPRDLASAPNILNAVCIRKTEIAIKPKSKVVPVEHIGMHALLMQLALDKIRDR
jgi:hypothetical protein